MLVLMHPWFHGHLRSFLPGGFCADSTVQEWLGRVEAIMGRCRAAGAQCFALLLDELTAAVVGPLARGAAGTDDSAGATAVDAATSLPPALCAALSERFQASCVAAASLTAGLSHSNQMT